jgi:hypothetical protein
VGRGDLTVEEGEVRLIASRWMGLAGANTDGEAIAVTILMTRPLALEFLHPYILSFCSGIWVSAPTARAYFDLLGCAQSQQAD